MKIILLSIHSSSFEFWVWMNVAESKSEGPEISELTYRCVVTSFHIHFLSTAINRNSLKWSVMCCNTLQYVSTKYSSTCKIPMQWYNLYYKKPIPPTKIQFLHTFLYTRIWVCRLSPIYRDISRIGDRVRYIGDIPTKECDLYYFPTIYYVQRDLWKKEKKLRYPPYKQYISSVQSIELDDGNFFKTMGL